jgi:hypothetical protein
MKTSDFMNSLYARHPSLKGEGKESVIDDIERNLNSMSDESRRKLWFAFLDDYAYDRAPKWSNLWQIAKAHGIQRSVGIHRPSYFVCNRCSTAFSSVASYCPKCKTLADDITVVVGPRPQGFIDCQSDCGVCKHYLVSGPKSSLGPVCPDFGTEMTGKIPQCGACLCRSCCREQYAMNQHLEGNDHFMNILIERDGFETDRLQVTPRPGVDIKKIIGRPYARHIEKDADV